MAGMPEQVEYATSIGGAAQYFRYIEDWLNAPDPATRRSRRDQARAKVGAFASVTAPTLAGGMATGGMPHFDSHWRAGSSGWWPNISPARVNEQMSSALASAFAPDKYDFDIRMKWDCSDRNLYGVDTFWATASVTGTVVWVDIRSPRAPGGPLGIDPATNLPNYGYNATSDLDRRSVGPFTALGDREVANYDSTAGIDTSFDASRNETVKTEGFRESWSFFPLREPVENGSQVLTGLSYTRDSWRPVPGREGTFEEALLHSETGYLLWDGPNRLAYRVIALPRGVTLLAVARNVGEEADELTFEADAKANEPISGGILSNPVLADAASTVHFTSTMRVIPDSSSFSYDDTAVQMRGGNEVQHTDSNVLQRV